MIKHLPQLLLLPSLFHKLRLITVHGHFHNSHLKTVPCTIKPRPSFLANWKDWAKQGNINKAFFEYRAFFMTVCLDTFQSSTPLPGPGPGRQERGIQTSPAIWIGHNYLSPSRPSVPIWRANTDTILPSLRKTAHRLMQGTIDTIPTWPSRHQEWHKSHGILPREIFTKSGHSSPMRFTPHIADRPLTDSIETESQPTRVMTIRSSSNFPINYQHVQVHPTPTYITRTRLLHSHLNWNDHRWPLELRCSQ